MVSRNIKSVFTRSASGNLCVTWHSTLKMFDFGKHKNIVDEVAWIFYCDECGELLEYNPKFARHDVNVHQGCWGSSGRNVVKDWKFIIILEDIKSVFIRVRCVYMVHNLVNDSERITI